MVSEPFVGEIRMFGGNFAPVGWALCNGQLQQIAQNFNLQPKFMQRPWRTLMSPQLPA